MKHDIVSKFPKPIEDFANAFVQMQIKRHGADYDPTMRYARSEVMQDIDNAETAMLGYLGENKKDRRAFSAYVLFRTRSI